MRCASVTCGCERGGRGAQFCATVAARPASMRIRTPPRITPLRPAARALRLEQEPTAHSAEAYARIREHVERVGDETHRVRNPPGHRLHDEHRGVDEEEQRERSTFGDGARSRRIRDPWLHARLKRIKSESRLAL